LTTKTLETITEEHENLIYPIVRVRHERVGGSGIVIYSKPTSSNSTKFESYVITCHHVVEGAIKFIKKWSSLAKRNIKTEERSLVDVEIFEYEELSRVIGGTTYQAEIVAWDKNLDVALLKLKTAKKIPYVATLYPKDKSDDIKLGSDVCSVGCSLGHEPIINYGSLSAKHDRIENREYWLSTANIIFGNSGGAEFLMDGYQFIGITARVSGVQLGFSVDIITWMGFFVPIDSIYNFLDEQIFQFVYDENYTSKICLELRKEKMKKEEQKLIIPGVEGEGKEEG